MLGVLELSWDASGGLSRARSLTLPLASLAPPGFMNPGAHLGSGKSNVVFPVGRGPSLLRAKVRIDFDFRVGFVRYA